MRRGVVVFSVVCSACGCHGNAANGLQCGCESHLVSPAGPTAATSGGSSGDSSGGSCMVSDGSGGNSGGSGGGSNAILSVNAERNAGFLLEDRGRRNDLRRLWL